MERILEQDFANNRKNRMLWSLKLSLLIAFLASASAWIQLSTRMYSRKVNLNMGIGDMLKKALANDPNLPPQVSPGLSKEKESIEVEFLPAKKIIKALPGQRLSVVAQAAGVDIKYKCKKGDCGTCTVSFDGIPTKVCQTSLPSIAQKKRYTITVGKK